MNETLLIIMATVIIMLLTALAYVIERKELDNYDLPNMLTVIGGIFLVLFVVGGLKLCVNYTDYDMRNYIKADIESIEILNADSDNERVRVHFNDNKTLDFDKDANTYYYKDTAYRYGYTNESQHANSFVALEKADNDSNELKIYCFAVRVGKLGPITVTKPSAQTFYVLKLNEDTYNQLGDEWFVKTKSLDIK